MWKKGTYKWQKKIYLETLKECARSLHFPLLFDDITKENIQEQNPNQPQILDHPYRILIIGGSGSGKTNSLFHLISEVPDIDKNIEEYDPNKKRKILIVFDDMIADVLSNKTPNPV